MKNDLDLHAVDSARHIDASISTHPHDDDLRYWTQVLGLTSQELERAAVLWARWRRIYRHADVPTMRSTAAVCRGPSADAGLQ